MQSRIVVLRRPNRAERQKFASDGAVHDARKLRRRGRFARDRQTAAERHEAHQVIATDGLMVDFRVASQIGKSLDEIIVDFLARRTLADNKGLASKFCEINFPLTGKPMVGREHDIDAFGPELPTIAAWPVRGAGYERDIKLMLSYRRDMLSRIAVDERQLHCYMVDAEGFDQVGQKS